MNDWLQQLLGEWKGVCRTWFQPEELADKSSVRSSFTELLGGKFIRHSYEGSMQGNPRSGEEWIAFNGITEGYQVCWIDSFHMSYAMMFSQGASTEFGFVVVGEYDVAVDQPRWGWKTVYEIREPDVLTITAFNVSPEGEEAKATETVLKRITD